MSTPTPPPRNTLYRQETRSSRRLTRTRLALYRAGVPVAGAIIRFCWSTTRVIAVIGEDRLGKAIAEYGVVIPVYWHQHQLLPVRYLLEHRERGLKLGFLVSPSVDGEMPAMLVRRTGGFAIRGSSSATGARALRDYFDAITKEGISPAITPDGPRGPAREFKAGAILLSQLSGKPMLPMAFAAGCVFRFPTWDDFILPLPGTQAVLAVGEPCVAPSRMDADALAEWQQKMRAELTGLYRQARSVLNNPGRSGL